MTEQSSGKKVAIVARHPKSRYLAPFDDPSWEIWTLSPFGPQGPDQAFTDLPRWDRFYELHSLTYLESQVKGAVAWLQAEREKRPGSVIFREDFPLESCVDNLGDYYTNTIAYLIAHAMLEGCDELAIYGVDMAHEAEYYWQRPCVEYWIARAQQAGIKVTVPGESDLLKHTRRYGFEEETPMEVNLLARKKELQSRIEAMEQEIETNLKQAAAMVAARGELAEVKSKLNGELTPDLAAYFEQRDRDLGGGIQEGKRLYEEMNVQVWMLRGCLEENKYHWKLI